MPAVVSTVNGFFELMLLASWKGAATLFDGITRFCIALIALLAF